MPKLLFLGISLFFTPFSSLKIIIFQFILVPIIQHHVRVISYHWIIGYIFPYVPIRSSIFCIRLFPFIWSCMNINTFICMILCNLRQLWIPLKIFYSMPTSSNIVGSCHANHNCISSVCLTILLKFAKIWAREYFKAKENHNNES